MKAFAKAIVNIPDNKAMDITTAILDNPKIDKKFMEYNEKHPILKEE